MQHVGYICQVCHRPVLVDTNGKFTKTCSCTNNVIIANLEANLFGQGSLNKEK